MYKYRVRIDTGKDIRDFVAAAERLKFDVFLENENGTKRGNAKTLLNVVDAMSYHKIYILSDNEIYTPFRNFIINET